MRRPVDDIRRDFPILAQTVHGKPLVYLDNAATTQLPQRVMDRWMEHYTRRNGNVHRGIHYLAEASTLGTERARTHVKRFLHGENAGELDMEAADRLLRGPVKLLATTLVSNVTGTVVDVDALAELAHERDIPVYVDAAQGLRHVSVNLAEQPWDFVGFSAHKLMGPTGVGCLFIRGKWLDEMAPCRYGGGMIDQVSQSLTTFARLPGRLEAGTPNYSGIIAFDEALTYLEELGLEDIAAYEDELLRCAEQLLGRIDGVHILGHPKRRSGAISITADRVHPFDAASMLDRYGVAVRSGSMCAQPIVHKMGADAVIRISPAFYNTPEEIAYMAQCLEKVIAFLRQYSN